MELTYANLLFGNVEDRKNKTCKTWYTAIIKNLQSSKRDEIELVKAKHYPSYGKRHVKAVRITDSTILFMPRIGNHFVQLVAISIIDCGLQEISKQDLQPFDTLRLLRLSDNLIEALPADLFDDTPSVEILCFRNNKIKFISRHTLAPLTQLTFADFRGNDSIDELYCSETTHVDGISLSMLMVKVALQCVPTNEQPSTISSYVRDLWEGQFSDFKINAKDEVFAVHKAILAANSAVFAAMFSHPFEENAKNEMTIAEFCPETVKEFLAFVYMRQIPQKAFSATHLYSMASEYQVNELSAHIQWLIVDEVNANNATEMYRFGVLFNNKLIQGAAFREIEISLNTKLPRNMMESVDEMKELLEAKDKLDEIVKRAAETYTDK